MNDPNDPHGYLATARRALAEKRKHATIAVGAGIGWLALVMVVFTSLPDADTGEASSSKPDKPAKSASRGSEGEDTASEQTSTAKAEDAKTARAIAAKKQADAVKLAKAKAAFRAKRAKAIKARKAAALKAKQARAAAARQAAAAAAAAQTDPQFGTCGEANAAGYGDYSSSDPEYSWYDDRDGDGIVCET